MNTKIKELLKIAGTDVSGKWIDVNNVEQFAVLLIEECIDAVNSTDRTHTYTSYDHGLVDATIIKSVQSIKQRFNI